MTISHIFISTFIIFLGTCMILGWNSGLKMRKQYKPLFIITEPRGNGESQNEEFTFAKAIKSQGTALLATLKLI